MSFRYHKNTLTRVVEQTDHTTMLFNPRTHDVRVLNETAKFIWDALDHSSCPGDIQNAMYEAYETSQEQIYKDVSSTLTIFKLSDFIVEELVEDAV